MSEQSSDSVELIHCGGCERHALLDDAHAAAQRDESSIYDPHCPRCGTRVSYVGTTVETFIPHSGDTKRIGRAEAGTPTMGDLKREIEDLKARVEELEIEAGLEDRRKYYSIESVHAAACQYLKEDGGER